MFAESGVIVGTVAAGLVALSPLAFAGGGNSHHGSSHRDHGGHHYVQADYRHNNHGGNRGGSNSGSGDRSCKQQTAGVSSGNSRGGGLINLSNNNIQVPVQLCNNNILSNLGLGILGIGSANGR
jgi:hypothetical protein